MEQFVSEIGKSGWLSVASLVIGALGVVLAVVFHRRTKRTKALTFEHRSVSIFRDHTPLMSKLEVMYEGKVTTNLTLTHIAFWNSGNETIRDIDLVENDPLRIHIGEGEILDAEVLCETHKANAIVVGDPTTSAINLSFQFLDAHQGGAVRVVHTCASRRQVDLKGTLMGAGTPKESAGGLAGGMHRALFSLGFRAFSRRETKWVLTFGVAFVTVLVTVVPVVAALSSTASEETLQSPSLLFALLVGLGPYWLLVWALHRRPEPRELERYLEDFGTEKES